MKIEMGKKYRTVNGRDVIILTTDADCEGMYNVVGLVGNSRVVHSWTLSGKFHIGKQDEHFFNLVEVNSDEFADLKIDDKVLVKSNNDQQWYDRHYAGNAEGKILVWVNGMTSWSVHSWSERSQHVECWDQWKLP